MEEILADLARNGPGDEELAQAHEQLRREYELSSRPMIADALAWWLDHPDEDFAFMVQKSELVQEVTAGEVGALAARAFSEGGSVVVTQVPLGS
jgi:hypothetical protein